MSTIFKPKNCRPTKISGFDPTPLWNHVEVISASSGGGNRVWTCNYCSKKVTGSYSKVKGHLLKLSGHGVKSCRLISAEEYCQVKKEYDEAEANKAKEVLDRQQKKDYITPLLENSDFVLYRRGRGTEGFDLGERSQSSKIVENIYAIPQSERSFIDLVKGINLQAVEEDSPVENKRRKVVRIREVTHENDVSTRFYGSKIDFLFEKDHQKVETEEDDKEEENTKESGDREETVIEMCANVNKNTSSIPASHAPTTAGLLERRILKNTTGRNTSVSILPTKSPGADCEDNKPLISGKRKFQIEVNPKFCNFKDGTSSIKPDLNQLYFPAAKEYLSKLRAVDVLAESAAYNIQSLQGILAVKEHLEELEAKLEAAKVSEKIYREKSETDAKTISLMRKRIKELEAYGKNKKEEVLDCAGYYTFKTKAELMKDFLDGKTDMWEPEKDIQIWEENFAEMTPPGTEDNFDVIGEDDKSNSSKKPSGSLERADKNK